MDCLVLALLGHGFVRFVDHCAGLGVEREGEWSGKVCDRRKVWSYFLTVSIVLMAGLVDIVLLVGGVAGKVPASNSKLRLLFIAWLCAL